MVPAGYPQRWAQFDGDKVGVAKSQGTQTEVSDFRVSNEGEVLNSRLNHLLAYVFRINAEVHSIKKQMQVSERVISNVQLECSWFQTETVRQVQAALELAMPELKKALEAFISEKVDKESAAEYPCQESFKALVATPDVMTRFEQQLAALEQRFLDLEVENAKILAQVQQTVVFESSVGSDSDSLVGVTKGPKTKNLESSCHVRRKERTCKCRTQAAAIKKRSRFL